MVENAEEQMQNWNKLIWKKFNILTGYCFKAPSQIKDAYLYGTRGKLWAERGWLSTRLLREKQEVE